MSFFSRVLAGVAGSASNSREQATQEMRVGLLTAATSTDSIEVRNRNNIKKILDEIGTLCHNSLTDDDLKKLPDILTKKLDKSLTQQLNDLELFKENLQLIINMRTSFSANDTLKIQNGRITFGDYIYKRSSVQKLTVEGWFKNKIFGYGEIIAECDGGVRRFESGEFNRTGLSDRMYVLKKGVLKIEKNGKVTEIRKGEFEFKKLLIFVKGESINYDTGVTLNGEFKSLYSISFLYSGTRKKNGTTWNGLFEYFHEIQKGVLCKGEIVDSDQTSSTLDLEFTSCKDKVLYFKGEMTTKQTQDGGVTRYSGTYRYDQELGKHILVDGTKTLPDGTTEKVSKE